jgi:hypothetical protein
MTTHISPAKTTRCKARLSDGRKLSNATITSTGQIRGYVISNGTRVFACGYIGGKDTTTVYPNGLGTKADAPIDPASVSWKDERGNVICPV